MSSSKSLILEDDQIRQKIRRMAYEIVESNFSEKTIVLAGVDGQGYKLAQLIAKELEAISAIKVIEAKVNLNKSAPQDGDVSVDAEAGELKNKCVVLVDDVLNTGRTLAYGMKPFLSMAVKKIEVAVLVNRSHALFPVQPNFTGYELSTTLSDHVEVVLGKKSAVYLH